MFNRYSWAVIFLLFSCKKTQGSKSGTEAISGRVQSHIACQELLHKMDQGGWEFDTQKPATAHPCHVLTWMLYNPKDRSQCWYVHAVPNHWVEDSIKESYKNLENLESKLAEKQEAQKFQELNNNYANELGTLLTWEFLRFQGLWGQKKFFPTNLPFSVSIDEITEKSPRSNMFKQTFEDLVLLQTHSVEALTNTEKVEIAAYALEGAAALTMTVYCYKFNIPTLGALTGLCKLLGWAATGHAASSIQNVWQNSGHYPELFFFNNVKQLNYQALQALLQAAVETHNTKYYKTTLKPQCPSAQEWLASFSQ